jgi:hypothetical protein
MSDFKKMRNMDNIPIGTVASIGVGTGTDLKEKFGFGKTPEGGITVGTRVRKVNSERGDVNTDGSEGTVIGGVERNIEIGGRMVKYLYLVQFDCMPKGAISGTSDFKLEEI